MAQIYILDIKKGVNEDICRDFFPERYEKSKKFIKNEDKLRSYGVAVLLKTLLGIDESDMEYGEYGKPYSSKLGKFFSISHSGDYCVLAVSHNNIGVDIEKINPTRIGVAKRVFTTSEMNCLKDNEISNFFKIWTMKECLSKAVGKGINLDFKEVDTLPLLEGKSQTIEDKTFYGNCKAFKNYIVSICTESVSERMEITETNI